MTSRTQHITLSALFMALGILIPFLFHGIGLGSVFIPMFWPIAVSAFFLPFSFAIAVGALTPLLSSMFTGMPPPPTLYKMIFELAFLAGCTCLLYRKTRYGIFWLLLFGLVLSRIVALLGAAAIAPILGLPPEFYAVFSLIEGTPGMIIMLVFLPLILKRITNEPILGLRKPDVQIT